MDLVALKELALRLLISDLSNVSRDPYSGVLASELGILAADDLELRRAPGSLQAWLLGQTARARDSIIGRLPAADQVKLQQFTRTLDERIRNSYCSTCTHANPSTHTCDGVDRAQDNEQVAARGVCIAIIHRAYRYLEDAVSSAVTHWALDSDKACCSDIRIQLGTRGEESTVDHTSNDGAPSPRDLVESSTTYLDDSREWRACEVSLVFKVSQIDRDALLTIPWLITQQLACHAFQGRSPSNPARPVEKDCPFQAGWMDQVAYELLKWDLLENFSAGTRRAPRLLRRYGKDAFVQGRDYRARKNASDPNAEDLEWGRDAADRTRLFFVSRHPAGSREDRERWALCNLVRLSYQIQRNDPRGRGHDLVRILSIVTQYGLDMRVPRRCKEDLRHLLVSKISDLDEWIRKLEVYRNAMREFIDN